MLLLKETQKEAEEKELKEEREMEDGQKQCKGGVPESIVDDAVKTFSLHKLHTGTAHLNDPVMNSHWLSLQLEKLTLSAADSLCFFPQACLSFKNL